MKSSFKIGVLGIGGVGGYLGALLSEVSLHSDVDVVLISRGENFNAIRSHGLKLITDDGERTYRPVVVEAGSLVPKLDLLLCCVKTYDLEQSLLGLSSALSNETIILPFLNGVDASEKISRLYPGVKVWKGAIYLVSRLFVPGVIKQSGPLNQVLFGSDSADQTSLEYVEHLFRKAGIKAAISSDINEKLWEKFFFISAMATITSYYNSNIGEIQNDSLRLDNLKSLLSELKHVALGISAPVLPDVCEQTFNKIAGLVPETTSSMLNDFRKGGKTEVDELTGYVTALGKILTIATPTYDMMYARLKNHKFSVFNN